MNDYVKINRIGREFNVICNEILIATDLQIIL